MKVVLIKDVKGTGRAHETVETRDGYALNYLIPQKFAVEATAGALREAAGRLARTASRKELDAALLAENIAALAETRIQIAMKANEKGHLYDAVDAADISRAVKEQSRLDIPEDAIKLEKPIKALGDFRVPVAAGEVFGEFSISIVAE